MAGLQSYEELQDNLQNYGEQLQQVGHHHWVSSQLLR